MDAHRGDVFTALYRVEQARPFSRARLIEMEGPAVGRAADTLARWHALAAGSAIALVGDGAIVYRDEIARNLPTGAILPLPLLAGAVGRLAFDRAAEALEPSAVRPLYVRRPDVEVARDKSLLLTGDSAERS
jgi:tRNA A37 threonylcarbamoyladenosine modification protein TsaB